MSERSDFDLPLGPARLGVRGLPVTPAWVSERYGAFAETPSAERPPSLLLRCRAGAERVVVPLPPPGGETVLDVRALEGRRFAVNSHWEEGIVDLDAGVMELELTGLAPTQLEMSFENAMRIAAQLHLVERGAFVLHASSVIDRGRVGLFFGPSGAGKSTVVELSRPRPALGDDLVLVEAGEEVPRARAVPFFMTFPPDRRAPGTHPLLALCRLRQAAEDRLVPLSRALAAATLSASVPYVHELRLPSARLTELVAHVAKALPAYDLHFTKSARFWTLLEEAC